MESELNDIREQVNTKVALDISMIVNNTLTEFCERQNKRNNGILFGVDDELIPDDVSEDERINSVAEMLSISNDAINHCTRIGKPDKRKRPLKVVFRTYEDKMQCFNNRRSLRDYNERNDCRISIRHDRTKSQMALGKALHDELLTRRKNGEDVVIRHGQIVTKFQQ